MGCCCSSCKEPNIELSHQEQEEIQVQRNAKRARQGLPPEPVLLDAMIGCCCCRVPALELSQQEEDEINAQRQAREAPSQQRPQPPIAQSARSSVASDISDLPPPYEDGPVATRATSDGAEEIQLPKTRLPYAIPLASFMNDEALLNTISKVHTANFSDRGVTQEQFLTFYYELDKRLAHQPDGSSAMLDNVMTILRENATSSGSAGVLPRVENFVELSNNDLFHPAGLHVEVLGNEDTKHKFISSPAQELDRTKTMTKLSKIEERLAKLSYKLERDIPDASDDEDRNVVQADYERRKKKLRAKANAVLAEYGRRTDAEMLGPYGAAGQEGPLWLIVSERSIA